MKIFEKGYQHFGVEKCFLQKTQSNLVWLLCILKALVAFQIKDIEYPGNVDDLPVNVKVRQDLLRNITDTYKETTLGIEKINNQKAIALKRSVWFIIIAITFLIVFNFLALRNNLWVKIEGIAFGEAV